MGDFILRKDQFDRVHTSQTVRSNLIEANAIIGPIFPNSSGITTINGSTVIVNSDLTCINASGEFKVNASAITLDASGSACINASGQFKVNTSTVLINATSTTINNLLCISDGTFLNPSCKFTSDTDTGIYKAGTNMLGIATGGDTFIFAPSGQVITDGNLRFISSSGGLLAPIPTVVTAGTSPTFTASSSNKFGKIDITFAVNQLPALNTATLTVTNIHCLTSSLIFLTDTGILSQTSNIPASLIVKPQAGSFVINITNMSSANAIPAGTFGTIGFVIINI